MSVPDLFDATFDASFQAAVSSVIGLTDWSHRVDYSETIEVEELGGDIGSTLEISYEDPAEPLEVINKKSGKKAGLFQAKLLNKTTTATYEIINPLWALFASRKVERVGMTIPQEVIVEEPQTILEVEANITPIVGYFAGVADRTEGDDLSLYPKYPKLCFQEAQQGINISFDDTYHIQLVGVGQSITTKVPGLHRYYEDNITMYNTGRRITSYVKLSPIDVESILYPNNTYRDLRGIYKLSINGEAIYCRLEEIKDYNPNEDGATKCSFITI